MNLFVDLFMLFASIYCWVNAEDIVCASERSSLRFDIKKHHQDPEVGHRNLVLLARVIAVLIGAGPIVNIILWLLQ